MANKRERTEEQYIRAGAIAKIIKKLLIMEDILACEMFTKSSAIRKKVSSAREKFDSFCCDADDYACTPSEPTKAIYSTRYFYGPIDEDSDYLKKAVFQVITDILDKNELSEFINSLQKEGGDTN